MKDYFVLASKNLKRRGIRSGLTLIGIFIGIAAVVSLISLGNTLKETVNAQFDVERRDIITIQAGGITMGPPGTGVSIPLIEDDAKAIERIGSVEWAISRHIETLRVEFNDRISFVAASSLPDNARLRDFYEYRKMENVAQGRLLREGERGRVLIGSNVADGKRNGFEKDLKVGDKILVNNQELRIVGILEKKGTFDTDGAFLMSEFQLKELSDRGNKVDIIIAKIRSVNLMDNAKEEIERIMRQRRGVKIGEENFEVSTPEATLKTVNSILMGVQIFIVIIASISILIGAIGISNTMFTSVLERRKEIGTMKAIGARNENIFYQFLIEAGLLGMIGGIIGILIVIGISYLGTSGLNSFLGINTKPTIGIFLLIFSLTGSFLIGAISGIIPAMRAAKQNPVEAMRS